MGHPEIVSVRPTRNGMWEIVTCSKAKDAYWERKWKLWFKSEGIHPEWWEKGKMPEGYRY